MSHFSVLVVLDVTPTGDELAEALQPFHEFECTGEDDQYVVDIDETAKVRDEFAGETSRRFKDTAGVLHDPHEDRFYREWTAEELAKHGREPMGTGAGGGVMWHSKDWGDGRGYRSKVHHCPEGFVEVEVARAEFESFREFVEGWHGKIVVPFGEEPDTSDAHKFGYALVDEAGEVVKVVDRTNPNKEWDWWTLGGRYANRLRLKGSKLPGNIALVVDLDFDAMREDKRALRRQDIAACMQKGATRAEIEVAALAAPRIRAAWMELPEPKPRGGEYYDWAAANDPDGETFAKVARGVWELPKLGEAKTLDEWVDAAPAFSTWAVLKDGEWTEKGSMGWFGMSSGDKDEDEWQASVDAMLAGLPATAWVAVVDCHI